MRGLCELFAALLWLCAIFVPLGMWKVAEILWWIFTHVSVAIS